MSSRMNWSAIVPISVGAVLLVVAWEGTQGKLWNAITGKGLGTTSTNTNTNVIGGGPRTYETYPNSTPSNSPFIPFTTSPAPISKVTTCPPGSIMVGNNCTLLV